MTSDDCDRILESLSHQVFCWFCAHICYRNFSLLSHFYSQLCTNYLMDVQLYEHAIENHPLFLLLELNVLWLKSSQYYCPWIQKHKFFKHGAGGGGGGGWRVEVRKRFISWQSKLHMPKFLEAVLLKFWKETLLCPSPS